MTSRKLIIALFALSSLFYLGCGSSSSEENQNAQASAEEAGGSSSEPKSIGEAMDEMQKAMQGDGEKKEVVDFRELKKLLPEDLAGMERTAHSGEKAGALGFNMSTATAEYRDGDTEMEVAIVDFAGVASVLMGMAAWSTVEIDREDENGYERTTTIDGYKAFEKYNSSSRSGELSVIASDRFIITVKGRNIDEKAFRKALEELDIDKLVKME
ncbi:MAG: hypothetical protein J5I94_06365 [Phaeodactylibacter sp.]|nr:hypothetical protein [Phaeodactylibacter sp.]